MPRHVCIFFCFLDTKLKICHNLSECVNMTWENIMLYKTDREHQTNTIGKHVDGEDGEREIDRVRGRRPMSHIKQDVKCWWDIQGYVGGICYNFKGKMLTQNRVLFHLNSLIFEKEISLFICLLFQRPNGGLMIAPGYWMQTEQAGGRHMLANNESIQRSEEGCECVRVCF